MSEIVGEKHNLAPRFHIAGVRTDFADASKEFYIMAMDLEREAEIDLAPQFPFQSLSISDDGSIADCLVGQSHRDEHALEVG